MTSSDFGYGLPTTYEQLVHAFENTVNAYVMAVTIADAVGTGAISVRSPASERLSPHPMFRSTPTEEEAVKHGEIFQQFALRALLRDAVTLLDGYQDIVGLKHEMREKDCILFLRAVRNAITHDWVIQKLARPIAWRGVTLRANEPIQPQVKSLGFEDYVPLLADVLEDVRAVCQAAGVALND